MIKVYYGERCAACHACMEWLKEQGIEFEATIATEARQNGVELRAIPTIDIDGKIIVGFRRDEIMKALKHL